MPVVQVSSGSQGSQGSVDRLSATASFYTSRVKPKSKIPERSPDRPRAGVLRSVGHADYSEPIIPCNSLSLDIDFGPTLNYASRSGVDQATGLSSPSPSRSPVSGSLDGSSRESPLSTLSRTPPPQMEQFEGPLRRPDYRQSRSLVWQPTGSEATPTMERCMSISAEDFVQQRAALASMTYSQPNHAPPRAPASTELGKANRPALRAYSSAAEQGPRPRSRGSSMALDMCGSGSGSSSSGTTKLSAQEQSHMARLTGQPLISMARSNHSTPNQASAGLVGAIDLRRIEKQQLRQDLRSHARDQDFLRNQQAQQQQQQQQYRQATQYDSMSMFASPVSPPPAQYSWTSGASVQSAPWYTPATPTRPASTFSQPMYHAPQQHWSSSRLPQPY